MGKCMAFLPMKNRNSLEFIGLKLLAQRKRPSAHTAFDSLPKGWLACFSPLSVPEFHGRLPASARTGESEGVFYGSILRG